jgi:hypothetical protein
MTENRLQGVPGDRLSDACKLGQYPCCIFRKARTQAVAFTHQVFNVIEYTKMAPDVHKGDTMATLDQVQELILFRLMGDFPCPQYASFNETMNHHVPACKHNRRGDAALMRRTHVLRFRLAVNAEMFGTAPAY